MTNKEMPGAADQSGDRVHDLPARTGLDAFEDSVKAAVRKDDLETLRITIGEILTNLGDAEHDDERRRRYREFLVRLLEEPLQAVGMAMPPAGHDEHRVIVMFCAEPVSAPYYIGTDFLRAGLLVARLRRIHGCRLQIGPSWAEWGGA